MIECNIELCNLKISVEFYESRLDGRFSRVCVKFEDAKIHGMRVMCVSMRNIEGTILVITFHGENNFLFT